MEIEVRNDGKIVEIWMTNEERRDQALQERLKPLYQEWDAREYLVAVFLSGGKDLEQQTSGLLCYNKKRIAELEVQGGKIQSAGIQV